MNNLASAAEAVVVALASSGHEAAFDELVRRKQSNVRSLMRYLSRDANLADDLTQQVFVEMWKSLHKLSEVAAFSGWLRKIAVNVWLQYARKQDYALQRATDSLDDVEVDAVDDPSPGHSIDLAAALALLAVPVRLCIVLAYQEGMSHADVATTTGLPLGTVKSHIVRGSARLKKLLSDYQAQS